KGHVHRIGAIATQFGTQVINNGRHFLVIELLAELRHGTIVLITLDRDLARNTVQHDLDQNFWLAQHPLGTDQWREYARNTSTRCLVTGSTLGHKQLLTIYCAFWQLEVGNDTVVAHG